ncbi:MAG TPA: GDP-mannose 4,6-dehydratase [Vicinamibacterales bacterium]|jgi:UDP-glucuronate 4-epimerase
MHVLVTGGAGFVGSHLVDALVRAEHRVTVLDNFDAFYERAIKERNIAQHRQNHRWRLLEADVRDREAMRRGLTGRYDSIVHLAAKAGVRPSIDDPGAYQDVNVTGTLNLLELARERGIRQFIFASSSSVYGMNPRVPWSEHDDVLRPISPYASTKVSAELLGHTYSHLHGIRFLALRLFTVYGPRQRPDLAVHKFTRLMLAGQPVPILGAGRSMRDYTFVEDVVAGILRAIEYTATMFEIINLGNNRAVSLQDVIRELEAACGVSATIDPQPEQPGDVPRTWANIEKATRLLGYAPRTTFSVGVRRFVEWYTAQPARAFEEASALRGSSAAATSHTPIHA